ncbi:hypothetical protein HPB50_007457 [Hyalomma asiaticum]|uniref:Uncharacterized protein n=1 Tax=Hyalomma asiaticum TaxID=266040 RepID=A0ACB7SP19_HYAAI|nr:hypothetical protein HPB50_007457 [Hyalomma asiaticum]
MTPRAVAGLLALVFCACFCTVVWYAARMVAATLPTAATSFYTEERGHSDCVPDEMSVLRNASFAQCFWVQAEILREKAADALAASGLSLWLKPGEDRESCPESLALLIVFLGIGIARWRRSRPERGTRVRSPRPSRWATPTTTGWTHPYAYRERLYTGRWQVNERELRTFSEPIPSTSNIRRAKPATRFTSSAACLPAPMSTAAPARSRAATARPPRATESVRRLSGFPSHSWSPSMRRGQPVLRTAPPFGQPHMVPASKWVFGELLRECRHGAAVTFDVVINEIGARACFKLSESLDSELFCVVSHWCRSVIKVLRFEYVVRHRDLVLAELRAGRQVHFQSFIREWMYCVWGKYPEVLTNACRIFRKRKGLDVDTGDGRNVCMPYVVLHMTFAGWPLSDDTPAVTSEVRSFNGGLGCAEAASQKMKSLLYRTVLIDTVVLRSLIASSSGKKRESWGCRRLFRNMSSLAQQASRKAQGVERLRNPLQLFSVVQQVALTLAVAEEAFEFEHRALSEDHVVVKKVHNKVLSFRLHGRVLHVNTFGVHAFLVDLCASRMTPRGDVRPLFTDLKKMPRNKFKAMGDTFVKIRNLVGEEPWLYCPKTNVACLEGLTRRLAQRFERRFAAAVHDAEKEAWCDLCFWLQEMPYCGSATELALQMLM